jgi:hypothetical protein
MLKSRRYIASVLVSACLMLSASLAMALPPSGVAWDDFASNGDHSTVLFGIEVPADPTDVVKAPDWDVKHERISQSAGGQYTHKVSTCNHFTVAVTSSSKLTDNSLPFEVGWQSS